MRIETREELRRRFKTWEELRDFVRAGGSLPPMYDDDSEGNRTQLVGMDRPATMEEIVRLFDEIESQADEEPDVSPQLRGSVVVYDRDRPGGSGR